MKKISAILTATVLLFSSFAIARGSDPISARAHASFLSDFAAASSVRWEKTSDFYFAKFTLNNVEVNAAYNEEGELIGTSRVVDVNFLPISISLALDKKYGYYTFSSKALEITYNNEISYYLTVSNDRQVLKLKCPVTGGIQVERRIRKL